MRYLDAHCHLYMEQYDADRAQVLANMQETATGGILIGVDLETSQQSVALAEQYDFLWAAIGLHPKDNVKEVFDIAAFTELAKHPKVVAIGECGLDYSTHDRNPVDEATRKIQKERFSLQIEFAAHVRKPLIIHCRDAHEDMLRMLKDAKGKHGSSLNFVLHFCTVPLVFAEQYLHLGAYLSFPGPVTFTDMYDDSIVVCPMDRFLIETDSPFAAPKSHRGRRNEPTYVEEVAEKIGHLKGLTPQEIGQASVSNATRIFGL